MIRDRWNNSRLTSQAIGVLASAVMLVGCSLGTTQTAPAAVAEAKDRYIAITLDDAPLPGGARGEWDRAGALVRGLSKSGVQAAFFATTGNFENVDDGAERLRRYGEAGHLIANHTHSHPWLYETDAWVYLADIDRAESRLEGLPNRRPWFRYPFLDQGRRDFTKRAIVREGLSKRGLRDGYVTADTYDWHLDRRWSEAVKLGRCIDKEKLEQTYADMVVDAAEHAHSLAEEWLGQQPVHVLLLHENDAAAAFLPSAIEGLRNAGWTIVGPDRAYAAPLRQPVTAFTGMGRVASLAQEAGARGEAAFDHWSASEEGIDQRLASLFDCHVIAEG